MISESALALICRVGPRLCAVPIRVVREIMRPLPAEPLDGMPAFVLGLALVRGTPTPVVDGRRLLGAEGVAAPARFVTLRVADGARHVALAVDDVVGVRALAAPAAMPPLVQQAAAEAVAAIGTLDAELLLVLRGARIVPDAAWSATS